MPENTVPRIKRRNKNAGVTVVMSIIKLNKSLCMKSLITHYPFTENTSATAYNNASNSSYHPDDIRNWRHYHENQETESKNRTAYQYHQCNFEILLTHLFT